MKIIGGVIAPSSHEEDLIMQDISLKIVMGKLEEAKQLAEQNKLLEYYELELEHTARNHVR